MPPLASIATIAPTFADLKALPQDRQSILLLMHLAHLEPQHRQTGGLHKGNLRLAGYGLAAGYPDDQVEVVRAHLLGMPWTLLVNRGYLIDTNGQGHFTVSEEGWGIVNGSIIATVSHAALESLSLVHDDLSDAKQSFREGEFKKAAGSAFRLIENKFNEIRDSSSIPGVASISGVNLPHALFDQGALQFPYPSLGGNDVRKRDAYSKAMKGILSGAIGLLRNSYDHEPYNLPELDETAALELLFFASYLLRLVELSEVP
jgi:hypothetical protein